MTEFSRLQLASSVLLLVFGMGARAVAQEPPASPEPDAEVTEESLDAGIAEREATLGVLQEKIQRLKRERAVQEKAGASISTSLAIVDNRIQETRLQLDHTAVAIEEVRLRLRKNRGELKDLALREEQLRTDLLAVLRAIDLYDHRSPLEMVLRKGTFTDFLQTQGAYISIERRMTAVLTATLDARRVREERARELQGREDELADLHELQETQKQSLETDQKQQKTLLAENVAQQAKVASLLAEAEEARREIQQEIFTLRNAGIRLSLKQAQEFSRYAGKLTGVRPALILGVLKVESNIGSNVGSGRYPDDIHPAHRDAFLRVTEELGLDPATTPVSAKPTTYEGWGGAMGPGQIMPGTWERVEPTVVKLTGRAQPSPFDLGDAFVATAVILQGAGAADGNEYEAVNRYFAGPNWQRFTWYGDRVLAVAKEYEARGL